MSDNINRDQSRGNSPAKYRRPHPSKEKLLSHIEISAGEYGPEAKTTEKSGQRILRKTIQQSMLDGIYAAAREKLFPNNAFTSKDSWFDGDNQVRSGSAKASRRRGMKSWPSWRPG